MPEVNKQRPMGNHRPQQRQGSLLDYAVDVSQLEDDWIKLTVYGQNRTGKTTLACTFPKPLLLISFEPNKTGGAQSIKNVPGVKLIRIGPLQRLQTTGDALKLANELSTDTYFKSVVIDSATSYQDLFLQEILGVSHLPEQLNFRAVSGDQYRERSERVKEGLRPFLNLDKHVVITAKEKDHNPPKDEKINPNTGKLSPDMRPKFLRGMQQESYVASDLGGAAVSWLHDNCDYIGRLYLDKEIVVHKGGIKKGPGGKDVQLPDTYEETGKIIHVLRTMYHPNFAAGFRAPDPSKVPEAIVEPDYNKIAAIVLAAHGGKEMRK